MNGNGTVVGARSYRDPDHREADSSAAISDLAAQFAFLGGQYSDHRRKLDHRDRGEEEVQGQFPNAARRLEHGGWGRLSG